MIKKTFFAICVLCAGVCTSPVRAEENIGLNCDNRNITVQILERLNKKTAYQYKIQGSFETPTPNYQISLQKTKSSKEHMDVVLVFTAPREMTVSMITTLEFSKVFTSPILLKSIDISLEKTFNWGPLLIKCVV